MATYFIYSEANIFVKACKVFVISIKNKLQ